MASFEYKTTKISIIIDNRVQFEWLDKSEFIMNVESLNKMIIETVQYFYYTEHVYFSLKICIKYTTSRVLKIH